MRVDGVLVWINPIVDGRDRMDLNKVLADVAASGVFVSAHPDVIAKMGSGMASTRSIRLLYPRIADHVVALPSTVKVCQFLPRASAANNRALSNSAAPK